MKKLGHTQSFLWEWAEVGKEDGPIQQYCLFKFSSIQLLSRVGLCDPMNLSIPGLPVHQQLPESTQTHVHRVNDAIQPSHPLLSRSPPALNLPQHWGLFKWVSSLHQVDKVLELQLQHQSFQWTPRTDLLRVSLQSKGLSRVFSNTTVQKHQFFGAQLSSQSNSHIHPWPPEKTIALTRRTFVGKVMSLLLNMLSRLVITFLLRSKHLLISLPL